MYAYLYQLEFDQNPGDFNINLYLGILFNNSFVSTPLGPALWGDSIKGDLWPLYTWPENAPLEAGFLADDQILYWDLPDSLRVSPMGPNRYLTTPMIVFSDMEPQPSTAAIFNGTTRLNPTFNSAGPVEKPVTIQDIIAFFEEKVEAGELKGKGRYPKIAKFRLLRMGSLLQIVEWLIEQDLVDEAIFMAERAYDRCDGEGKRRWNRDFVKDVDESGATAELADMIQKLIDELLSAESAGDM